LDLLDRVGPVAVQGHDLGTVDEALAAVEHQLGLVVAPAAERGGPRAGSAYLEHLLTALDRRAVGVTDGNRGDLTGLHRNHGLVQ
jgi:hypothetical protein